LYSPDLGVMGSEFSAAASQKKTAEQIEKETLKKRMSNIES